MIGNGPEPEILSYSRPKESDVPHNLNEEAFLRDYDPAVYKRPNCTVDTVIFKVIDSELYVLINKRQAYPFKGCWALVGGFVDLEQDKNLEDTARKKLLEKTAVKTPYLEQYATVGNAWRDPRGWSITTVYFALIAADELELEAPREAWPTRWARIEGAGIGENLAFDHDALLAGCLKRLRDKAQYTSLPIHLLNGSFTLGELQKVYEIVLDKSLEGKSFRRRLLAAGILETTGEFSYESKRPARLYRYKKEPGPHVFMRNLEGSGRGGKNV
jgi:ADP-ribose pyrophosphatase YjhB (NUDIX family)